MTFTIFVICRPYGRAITTPADWRARGEACPRCGEEAGIPIFYGMPSRPPDNVEVGDDGSQPERPLLARMFERRVSVYRTEEGEQASGGCVLAAQRWVCKECGNAW
jgi:hypothetical protein